MPLSLTDAVLASDTNKHFRESYNAARTEITELRATSSLVFDKVNEDFQFFIPDIVDDADNASGVSGAFSWGSASGGANNSIISTPGTALPSGTSNRAIKVSLVQPGTIPLPVTFRYQARNTFTFGSSPGQISEMIMHVRYAVSTPTVGNTSVRFGLYDGTNVYANTKGINVEGNLVAAAPTEYFKQLYGIGAPVYAALTTVATNTWTDIAIKVTPTLITYYVNGVESTQIVVPATYTGVPFNLALSFYTEDDSSTETHFIDSIGYEITKN